MSLCRNFMKIQFEEYSTESVSFYKSSPPINWLKFQYFTKREIEWCVTFEGGRKLRKIHTKTNKRRVRVKANGACASKKRQSYFTFTMSWECYSIISLNLRKWSEIKPGRYLLLLLITNTQSGQWVFKKLQRQNTILSGITFITGLHNRFNSATETKSSVTSWNLIAWRRFM